MIGNQSPRPANQSRANGANPNPPRSNRPKPPPIAPANRAKPSKPSKQTRGQSNPPKPGPMFDMGQTTPAKHWPKRWGPIAPQTGQTINPGQSPANPKQPRKRGFEVSAHLLSKAKKTPVLPGVVLVLRQFPIVANIKL